MTKNRNISRAVKYTKSISILPREAKNVQLKGKTFSIKRCRDESLVIYKTQRGSTFALFSPSLKKTCFFFIPHFLFFFFFGSKARRTSPQNEYLIFQCPRTPSTHTARWRNVWGGGGLKCCARWMIKIERLYMTEI